MSGRILKLDLYQPFAHFREPKIMQDDYLPTLNVPSPTTIAGMISYVCDYKFEKEIDIGVCTQYKTKDIHFIRGEYGSFFESYINQKKNNRLSYMDFKSKKENRIINYEVLQEVFHTVFIKLKKDDEFDLVRQAFETPKRYISLGRKEDFVIKSKKCKNICEDITDKVKCIEILSKRVAIVNKYKISNMYVPVKLEDEKCKDILASGLLYTIPRTYKDIKEDKTKREVQYGSYVYIDDMGYYPKEGQYNLYEDDGEKIVFKWLVKEVGD